MSEAVASSLGIVAYLALFFGVGLLFIFVNLLIGRFLRPHDPHEEKEEIYECGEPAIGSSFVQFDLRFYVVALLFIIFDVEVAFFFPWATVFGKTNHVAAENFDIAEGGDQAAVLTPQAVALYREMGVRNPTLPTRVPASLRDQVKVAAGTTRLTESQSEEVMRKGAKQFALVTIVDIAVFFGVLLIGFAYVWKRGDLDWVRAVSKERSPQMERAPPEETRRQESALSV